MTQITAPNYIKDIKNWREGHQFNSSVFEEKLTSSLNFLEANGLPTHKHEDWKYTAIQNYLPKEISFKETDENIDFQADEYNYHLVICNGVFDPNRSTLPEKGVNVTTFTPTSEALNLPEGDELDHFCKTENEHFNHLNLATLKEGIIVTINNNQSLDKPIKITHLKGSDVNFVAPRIQFNIGHFCKLTIWENFSNSQAECFENTVTQINIAQSSNVTYVNDAADALKLTHINMLDAEIGKDSHLKCFYFSGNCKMVRNNINIDLIDENANVDLNGLYACSNDDHSDQFITVNHQKSHTYSNQLFKGILSGNSRGVFTGKVIVHRDAQQVDSSQLNKNLLLSEKAHVDTRPQLEVYADDVKCAHGATVGQLNPEEIFYLESRGISGDRAFHLLCEGFAKEVYADLSDSSAATYMENAIENAFKRQ